MSKRQFQLAPALLGLCVLPLAGLPLIAYLSYANIAGESPSGIVQKTCLGVGAFLAAAVFELADRFGYLRSVRTHKSLFRARNQHLETERDTSVRSALRAAAIVTMPASASKLIAGAATDQLVDTVVNVAGEAASDVTA